MLGLEHETSRGSITIDYYGRTVGIKIMPTGVYTQPHCLLEWMHIHTRAQAHKHMCMHTDMHA